MPGILGHSLSKPVFLLQPDRLPEGLRRATIRRELKAGETLYRRGDEASAIFALERGRLQLFSYTSQGKPVPLYVIRPGECVSEPALYAEHYCGDVVAEVTSRVLMFPKPALLCAFHQQPLLANEFMELLTRRFNLLRIRLELRNLPSASDRILQYLAVNALPGQSSIKLDRPLKSIADDLGLSPESFYRTLAQLVREGAIRRRKNAIAFRLSTGKLPWNLDRSEECALSAGSEGNGFNVSASS